MPNISQTESGNYPAGNLFGPFLFGGYDINNKLPYTENWTFDIQYQASNSWLFSAGYVGNHGVHEVLPIPFNQPQIATPQHPVNGQIYSYGGVSPNYNLDLEPISTNEYSGNAPIRVPYIGYDMNSVLYKAEGISNYNALQLQIRKRLSFGLQFTASYTWSHALDEQSGLGLFFTGNNPLIPKSNYALADFDQTHVFLINYSYQIPKVTSNKATGLLAERLDHRRPDRGAERPALQRLRLFRFGGQPVSRHSGLHRQSHRSAQARRNRQRRPSCRAPPASTPASRCLNVNDFAPAFLAPGAERRASVRFLGLRSITSRSTDIPAATCSARRSRCAST